MSDEADMLAKLRGADAGVQAEAETLRREIGFFGVDGRKEQCARLVELATTSSDFNKAIAKLTMQQFRTA